MTAEKQIDTPTNTPTKSQYTNCEIEEMARFVSKCITSWLNNETPKSSPDYIAEAIYNAGYRKASDLAEEIFAEIDRMIYKVLNDKHYIMGDMCYEVAELKKKYMETEGGE